tara:strand:+ start:1002 stop:1298 length:297 start_codon:yes stop_codon:yes gene_type:complete
MSTVRLGNLSEAEGAVFMSAKIGDFVVVKDELPFSMNRTEDWWIGQIVYCVGGARSSSSNSIFQIVNIDTGTIKVINADLVIGILKVQPSHDQGINLY